jgi:hypothetical protein
MIFLGNASSDAVRDAMRSGRLGQMCTPAEGRAPLPGVTWAADNGCFGRGFPGEALWWAWLGRHARHADRCLFATAPDVFDSILGRGDAPATLRRSCPWLPKIRGLGFRAALVAQDGLEDLAVPWHAFDVLFVGGSTAWKLSSHAARLMQQAQVHGLRVHLGRCNSASRIAYAAANGCASVDGTCLARAPDRNLPRVLAWMSPYRSTPPIEVVG